jgi:hypothetical protein
MLLDWSNCSADQGESGEFLETRDLRSLNMTRQNLSIGRLIGSTALTVTLILGVLASSGCYRRVVGAKNAPGYTGPVYEENVKEGNESLFQTRTVTPKGSYYVD